MSHIQEEFEKIESEHGWDTLFKKLQNDHNLRTLDKKNDIALIGTNRRLNRFRDVLPYDDTRVRLQCGSNDYINANYIRVPQANRTYILTQGPLATTAGHFWQMVWEQNSRAIVMLTGLNERGFNKCWLYYPDYETESELLFDEVDLKVTYLSEKQEDHCTQRKFELSSLSTGETHPIIHWSDFDWPDYGTPSSPDPLLQLISDVRHYGAFDSRFGPPIIHCSAGIGRSGTFVFIDSILKIFAQSDNPNDVSLTEILAHIRTQRHGLIQKAEQLRFSYMAIVAGLKQLNELEQDEDLFNERDFDISSESDNDSSELNTSLENINHELTRRTSQPLETTDDIETSLRLREERLKRNESIKKKVDEIKAKLYEQSSSNSSSLLNNRNKTSILTLMTKYRRPFFIGLLIFVTGSFFLYRFVKVNDRTY